MSELDAWRQERCRPTAFSAISAQLRDIQAFVDSVFMDIDVTRCLLAGLDDEMRIQFETSRLAPIRLESTSNETSSQLLLKQVQLGTKQYRHVPSTIHNLELMTWLFVTE